MGICRFSRRPVARAAAPSSAAVKAITSFGLSSPAVRGFIKAETQPM